MRGHTDILDARESLRTPLIGSVLFHCGIFATLFLVTFLTNRSHDTFGDPDSLGGAGVTVTPVSSIPLPDRGGIRTPVANDTESKVPAPPKPQPKQAVKEDPDAIPLKGRTKAAREKETPASRQRYRTVPEDKPNQLYSSTGQTMSNPMYGLTAGSGGVGVGSGSPFGNRFGAYAQLLRDRVARAWRTQDIDPRLQTAPPVIVLFDVLRSGEVRNIRLFQRSGIPALDYSAQRAVQDAAPFPPLPAGYERDSATVELVFHLKR